MSKSIFLVLSIMICSTVFGAEGFYFKQKNTISGQTTVSTQYITRDFIKSEDDNNITILSNTELRIYDKISKTYFIQSLENMAKMTKIADSQFIGFEIKATGEKCKLGVNDTEVYQASFKLDDMDAKAKIFVLKSSDIPADLMFKLPSRIYPEAKNIKNMIEKLKATGGFQVKSITTIKLDNDSTEMVTELEDVKKMEIIDTIFQAPKNFRQIDPPAYSPQDQMEK